MLCLWRFITHLSILWRCGDVAQLGERRVRNAKVGSSILLVSTKQFIINHNPYPSRNFHSG